MKNHNFQELVDQNLSGLVWDEHKRLQVLRAISKEEKPVKKASITFILAAAVLCLSISALAAGLLFSPKVDTIALANQALLEKYGITAEMHTFFSRTGGDSENEFTVSYRGTEPFSYVLGSYTVSVRNGKAEAVWSHDNTDTVGGFDAVAWGAEQLAEILRVSRETGDISHFGQKAVQIAAEHGVLIDGSIPFDESVILAQQQAMQLDAQKAKDAAKLSLSEIEVIARDALAMRQEMNQEQLQHLTWQEESSHYLLYGENEAPCYSFYLTLGFAEDGYQGEGAGIYIVIVNVVTGLVEDMLYDSALGGHG